MRQTINIGTNPNDGTGDPLRNAYDKCNDNFLELYDNGGDNITVTDPTTSTDATLNDALQNVLDAGGGGGTQDLQSVLTEGATATDKTIELNSASSDDVILLDAPSQTMGVVNLLTGAIAAIKSTFVEVTLGGEGIRILKDKIRRTISGFYSDLVFTNPTANRTITFKDESGTVAYLSDIPSSSAYKFIQTSQTAHTGTILETLIATATINGGSFSTSDVMKVLFGINKTGTGGTYTLRLRVNTLNTLVGATQVALFTSAGSSAQMSIMSRSLSLNGGNLYGYSFTGNALTDIASIGGALSSTAYNTANTLYFFFTVQLANAGDSITPNLTNLTN